VSKTVESGGRPLTILHPLDLSIASGRFLAIVGPSGSGKSTLLGLLAGLDAPSTGEILVDGTDITKLGEDDLARLRGEKIGFVFQFFHLVPELTGEENVLLPARLPGARNGALGRGRELIARLGLEDAAQRLPHELSGGEQQRLAVARALVHNPPLVLADEPTGNLDTEAGAAVLGLLRAAAAADGRAVVIVTHDVAATARADRVLHLVDGRLV
jgi:putative ABC transport system ATP-binding protein